MHNQTRKQAPHARMPHSTGDSSLTGEISTPVVCSAACVQGKRSCKREREICVVHATKRGYGYVCVIIKKISSTQLLVCVCVCVCVCVSWSAPGSAIKEAPRDVWVCLCARKIKGRHGCVYVCVYVIITLPSIASCVYVSICMLTPVNDCDYIRQYFTINYKVLCIKNGIVFPHIYIMQPSQ